MELRLKNGNILIISKYSVDILRAILKRKEIGLNELQEISNVIYFNINRTDVEIIDILRGENIKIVSITDLPEIRQWFNYLKVSLMELSKSELKGKNFKSVLSKECTNGVTEDELMDIVANFELTVCNECGDICDSSKEAKYVGYDFTFTDKKAEEGDAVCDRCFIGLKNIHLIKQIA